jgi:hypothetical protein
MAKINSYFGHYSRKVLKKERRGDYSRRRERMKDEE